ncbi:MAG TPA: 30S ribosomal protein S2 [bacterium]|nr:30S ribosomal protein S2 [bacterium]
MLTMKQMLEAGVHFGHQTQRWNPKMKPYIFGARNGIYIIDLQKTVDLFKKARAAVVQASANGGKVLFVGTKKQAADTIREESLRCGMYYVNNRWLGGTLTNFVTVKNSVDRLKRLEQMKIKGDWGLVTKKEGLKLEKEMYKLDKNLGGIKNMDGLPSVLFIVDPRKERIAVHEANRLGIPVVAITDTNCDPEPIDYLIPSNDDAIRAIRIFAHEISEAVLEGQRQFEERMREKRSKAEELARKPVREKLEELKEDAPPPSGVDIEIKRSRRHDEEAAPAEEAQVEAAAADEEAGE